MEERGWMTMPLSFCESCSSPSIEPMHRESSEEIRPQTETQPRQLLLPTTTELKKREEDGARAKDESAPPRPSRAEIAATLQQLHGADEELRQREATAREAQRDATRGLVKLMHLDTTDQTRIETHTAHVRLQHEISAIQLKMRRLEDRYQQAKKDLSMIPDKTERHHQVLLAKDKRDAVLGPLRERLRALDSTTRPSSSHPTSSEEERARLPVLKSSTPERKASSATYHQVTDQIRDLQKTRKSMLDPYMANLKMAKLWHRINDPERALENYEKAVKCLSEKERAKVPDEDLGAVLEAERRRRREALQFMYLRALDSRERAEAARMMKQYLELSTACERLRTAACLEELLRKQEYVEDPSLSTPEDVTANILCSKSLGPLTDLRFELLQELLAASPTDPYLLESVANFHVRKSDFEDAKGVCDRFVKLPDVKRIQLFASFAEYSPVPSTRSTSSR